MTETKEIERGVLKPGQWTDDTSMVPCIARKDNMARLFMLCKATESTFTQRVGCKGVVLGRLAVPLWLSGWQRSAKAWLGSLCGQSMAIIANLYQKSDKTALLY